MKDKLDNRKRTLVVIAIMLVCTVGFTLAYFTAQLSGDNATNVKVTSKTQSSLLFNKGDDIVIDAGVDNFFEGSGDAVAITKPSVSLTAPELVTESYNVYFEITKNTFIYTTDSSEVELLLTILDEEGIEVKEVEGLEYVTVGDKTGFDITTKEGLFEIISGKEITTDNDTTTEEWTFTVSFINLDTDQFFNSGKVLEAEVILQKGIKGITPVVSAFSLSNDSSNTLTVEFKDNGATIQGIKVIEEEEDCTIDGISLNPIELTTSTENKVCIYNNADEYVEEVLNLAKITYNYEAPAVVSSSYVIVDLDSSYSFDKIADLSGYLADGWYSGETEYTDFSQISGDVVLTAKYIELYSLYDTILTSDGDGYASVSAAQNGIEGKGAVDFSVIADTDEGLNAIDDDYGTSYYYRGAVEDNWVKFGGYYWRIIRLDGDAGIKLIYSGSEATGPVTTGTDTQISTSAFNSSSIYLNDGVQLHQSPEGVGYVYEDSKLHGLTTDSAAKSALDTWYSNNLLSYESYLDDSKFCIDRTGYTDSENTTVLITNVFTGNETYISYGGRYRLMSNKIISIKCNDSLDVLSLKIGLVSAHEVSLAGGLYGTANSTFYLYTGQTYWTLTPYYFSVTANVINMTSTGNISNNNGNNGYGLRPSVTLKANTLILKGEGSMENPYEVV